MFFSFQVVTKVEEKAVSAVGERLRRPEREESRREKAPGKEPSSLDAGKEGCPTVTALKLIFWGGTA